MSIFLRNARTVLKDRVAEPINLQIEGSRIAAVSSDTHQTANNTIDCTGLTVYPGFIDVHIHGAVGVDTMAASTDDLRQVSSFLATQGVTAWLPTLVPSSLDNYQSAVGAIAGLMADERPGAIALGVHYEGPYVNSLQCGALRPAYIRKFASPDELDSLATINPPAKHMMTVAPEAGGRGLIRELVTRGWIVSIGHTRADLEQLDDAFVAGAHHMTHFMNAMPQLHHRAPGPVGWGLAREDVTCDIVADGIHLDPFMLKLLTRMKGTSNLTLISDAIAAAGKGDGEYEIWGEQISVANGKTSNHQGSIAGSVITMLDAVRMMLSLGLTETGVAAMSAANPARLLGIDRERGSIEEGKRADLVALDHDGNVVLTLIGGDVAYRA
jgi:N-acetylglucosamine-6-phosphate deacetylase